MSFPASFFFETWFLFLHHMRTTLRMPVWVIISIVQPILWLALFGQLFRVMGTMPGFSEGSYQQFLAPGLVIMSATMGSSYSGIGILTDIQNGVMDRLLATPVGRGSLLAARVLQSGVTVMVQGVIILLVALLFGIDVPGGLFGVAVVLMAAAVIGAAASAFSNGMALIIRQPQVLVAVVNFILLPMVFLSSLMMSEELMPAWIRKVAMWNPLNWGVVVARGGFQGEPWSEHILQAIFLVLFFFLGWLASLRSFDRYRKTL